MPLTFPHHLGICSNFCSSSLSPFFYVMTSNVGNCSRGDLLPVSPLILHMSLGRCMPIARMARECAVPRNPNAIGYPFPPNTRAVSFSFLLFFLSLPFLFLFQSLTLLSSNCNPLSKSMRSWYGWSRISSWR